MSVPTIYKSSDPGAPVLFNSFGALIDLLDACLVNGYGGGFAVGTITSDGTNVADGDTVTVGSRVYTFKTTRAAPGDVVIGANAAASLTNLQAAINLYNASAPTWYFVGTLGNADAWCPTTTATVLTVQARVAGTAGNAIVLARTSAGTPHLTVSGATLAGGVAGTPKASAGWTKDYASLGRAIYRPGAGTRCYLEVIDNNPDNVYFGPPARVCGFETISALGTGIALSSGSGQFGQAQTMCVWKYGNNPVATPSNPWILMADNRTAYLWYWFGGNMAAYAFFAFGDMQSLIPGDVAKTFLHSGQNFYTLSQQYTYESGGVLQAATGSPSGSIVLQRNWSGIISNLYAVKMGDQGRGSNFQGQLTLPHSPDGGLYISPVYIMEGSSSGGANQRGIMRGIYQPLHVVTSWNDGDLIPGTGALAGHTFLVVKPLCPASSSPQGAMLVDISDWVV